MAEATLVQEGLDRVESAVKSLDKEFQKIQKDWSKRRRTFEKNAQKQVDQLVADVRKSPVAKRAKTLRKEAAKQFDQGVEGVLDALQIASRREVARIDRKLSQINKKLRAIEKSGANGSRA